MLQKNNGVLLKIDSLGRIVIPSKFREILDIKKNKYLIMSLEDDNIKISKYDDSDYLELVNDKFCNIWIENNKKDTIIVTDLYEVKCVLGNNENKYNYDKLNENVLNVINDEYFSFKKFRNCILFDKRDNMDFDVFALYNKESRLGNLIIIHNSKAHEYNMKFVYDILNSL